MPPLGWPIRREDWYIITDTLVSATVVIYPGELVGCSESLYNNLAGATEEVDEKDTNVIVVHYAQMAALLEKNGFVKL